ncbi:MAG TPA: methyltransferase domain-containing protein [Candidatus Eisenbacteria bacterium]|nr:methyltransferase domain-containing protein [Candidatus Eisenbacteria bacterium]
MSKASSAAVEDNGWPLHAIGRRAHSTTAYMLPRHPAEIDRLDLQHYALRAALKGNYVAPVECPASILDVGSGTGQWAYDVCEEFPRALVVGFDVEPSKPDRPSNYRFVRGDLLHGLPFVDGGFDFVHQRLLQAAIPLARWPEAVCHLLRVTRPGGYVELTEIGDRTEPAGPAITRLWGFCSRLASGYGLDWTRTVPSSLHSYLERAGAVDVQRHHVAVPIGAWGATLGEMMAADLQALFTRLCPQFEARLGVPAAEAADLVATALQECETYRTNAICTFAYGRRPG